MGRLIIDGNNVYEIDEECVRKRKVPGECEIYDKLKLEYEKRELDKQKSSEKNRI